MNTDEHRSPLLRLGCSVPLTRKSFAGRKGFFFAKSSRSSRLRGESWAGLSQRRREAREEHAKDLSLVAAMPRCVHLWFHSCFWVAAMPRSVIRGELFSANFFTAPQGVGSLHGISRSSFRL